MAAERDDERVAPEPLTVAAMHLARVREARQTIVDGAADADGELVAGWAEETLAVMVEMSESLVAAWDAVATAMERAAGPPPSAVDGPAEPTAEALLEPTSFLDDLTMGNTSGSADAA